MRIHKLSNTVTLHVKAFIAYWSHITLVVIGKALIDIKLNICNKVNIFLETKLLLNIIIYTEK